MLGAQVLVMVLVCLARSMKERVYYVEVLEHCCWFAVASICFARVR